MELASDPKVKDVFDAYPESVRPRLLHLRGLVLSAASEIDGLEKLEETLKWGEPSYLTKHCSTVRIDWKEKKPDQVGLYFKCTSKLVQTFKEIYRGTFKFETTRAIIFDLTEEIPDAKLKRCISMALTYHKIKHLPLLGHKTGPLP